MSDYLKSEFQMPTVRENQAPGLLTLGCMGTFAGAVSLTAFILRDTSRDNFSCERLQYVR